MYIYNIIYEKEVFSLCVLVSKMGVSCFRMDVMVPTNFVEIENRHGVGTEM